jgi:hypothetical protein
MTVIISEDFLCGVVLSDGFAYSPTLVDSAKPHHTYQTVYIHEA